MKIIDLVKSQSDFVNITQEIKSGRMAKSTLLFSHDNVYAKEFALALAIAILNNGDMSENVNYLKVVSSSHPDVKSYPLKDKLLVADSEEIVDESFVKPIFSDKKIFIINNIDNSMESAQNKLLKVLEEPSANVYFILTATNENQVLSTIKSRCNKVELKKLSKEKIEGLLSSYEGSSLLAVMSDFNIGRALDMGKKGNAKDVFLTAKSIVCEMTNSKNLLNYSKKVLSLKNDYDLFLETLAILMEDMLFIKTDLLSLVRFKDSVADLSKASEGFSVEAICQIRRLIDNAVKEISFSANLTLVIENLLLNILEVKYICR